jgi:2-dehydropantoate 2-reductase
VERLQSFKQLGGADLAPTFEGSVRPRILIFGAGAIGCYFGGKLAVAGNDVTFIARGARLVALQNGLTLKGDDTVETIAVNAVAAPVGLYDLIIISVKAHDTATAAEAVKAHLAPDGVVLSMQNGVDNADTLLDSFNKVLLGIINSGISIPTPGLALYRGTPRVSIGAATPDTDTAEVVELFKAARIEAKAIDDPYVAIWQKLIWNMAFNPLSALMGATCGELLDSPYSKALMVKMGAEVVAAAAARGVTLPENSVTKALTPNQLYSTYKTSSLQDVEMNRVPEIDGLMLPVVNLHREGKIAAPACEAIYKLAKFKFTRWFHTFPRLAADVMVIDGDKVLLIERKFPPFGWALPGGMVDYGECVEHAAVRELLEETAIDLSIDEIKLLGVYSEPSRDFRGHTASVIYYAYSNQSPTADDDAANAQYFSINSLPELAFDHKKIIAEAVERGLFR